MKKQLLTLLLPVMLILACSKKDEKPSTSIDQEAVSLNYDQTHQFKLTEGNTNVESSRVKWTSSDQAVGSIDAAGLFAAKRIGKTTITAVANGSTLTAEVTVVPYSELCKEPILDFGASISAVKGQEKRVLVEQSSTALMYKGENAKLLNVFYGFESTGLESSVLLFSPSEAVVEESVKFLSERYEFAGESEGLFFFSDAKTAVGLGVVPELGFVAVYFKDSISATGLSQAKTSKAKLIALKQAFVESSNALKLIKTK